MELNKIYNIDAMEGLRGLPDNSIDMVLTDIPYGSVNRASNGLRNLDKGDADIFNLDLGKLISEIIRVTRGSIYMFCGYNQVSEIYNKFVENGLTTRMIVWEKSNPSPMNSKSVWMSGIEIAMYGKKHGGVFNGFYMNTVLKYPLQKSKIHPTQKSLSLFKKLIEISSNENDTVLDAFMGSGTTAVACKELNRKYIGFEINNEYVRLANERIKGVD